jgi:pyruvate dehydrogenase E2 component (dihydrolipoamide acetyltransferase)
MARQFLLPDLGEGLTEAEIVAVLVHEGDVIQEDAPLLEVETDKAQVEIPSPLGGRVEKIHVAPGQTVQVGAVLVTFADASNGAQGAAAAPAAAPARASGGGVPAAVRSAGPVPATPSTRKVARELGVDLRAVRATGPGGRVTEADVRAAAGAAPAEATADAGPARGATVPARTTAAGPAPAATSAGATPPAHAGPAKPLAASVAVPPLPRFEQWGPIERAPLSHLRRTIAERMTLSATVIPHVTHFDRADITDLDALIRTNLDVARGRGVTLTLTSFLLKAAALTLAEHPQFNASLDAAAGELILKRYHHLGVAVATERGLIVPVIRDVDQKPMLALARELAALAQRVRDGKATLEDLRGGTFTVTNIGALGGTGAIPIINYPEVAILGVARGREEPVVREGVIVPRLVLPLSLTFDHRVADGADGARFAADLVRRLEHPDQLLLEL